MEIRQGRARESRQARDRRSGKRAQVGRETAENVTGQEMVDEVVRCRPGVKDRPGARGQTGREGQTGGSVRQEG